ncbi:MAG: rhodanese-like domain-containing protein [Aridibacter famidurans]|nr:rhodanese-like domain-containing protein [Aridibacter famidurans]
MAIKTIDRETLKEAIDRGEDFTLVETLAKTTYEHAHLPGAINIPPDKLRELAPERLPDKDERVIVYCSKPS